MKSFGLIVVLCVGLCGCPPSDHPIVGTWRFQSDSYLDGELIGSNTDVEEFSAFGQWIIPSFDGTNTFTGTWRETSETTVIADITARFTSEGVSVRQDLTYELTVNGHELTGSGTANICIDLDCVGGEQVVTAVRVQ